MCSSRLFEKLRSADAGLLRPRLDSSDPELVRQVLVAAGAGLARDPAPAVEFVEVGLSALRFDLQVWSTEHVTTAGTLKAILNFAVWRQLRDAGVASHPPALTLGLQLARPDA